MNTKASTKTVGSQTAGLRILIVEDQRDIAANIWDFFERRGYIVDHAVDGQSGLTLALSGGFDVVVLDLGLPRLDGLDLCHRLRATGNGVPVLMLTARDTLDDRLRGFAEGADDYLVKPFAMRELEARIQALHRRGRPAVDRQLQVGSLGYDPRSMLASYAGSQVPLTRAQGRLLMTLMNASPAVVAHRDLLHAVWGEEGGDIASLHTHVYDLRALLGASPNGVAIQSVRGFGYRLVARS